MKLLIILFAVVYAPVICQVTESYEVAGEEIYPSVELEMCGTEPVAAETFNHGGTRKKKIVDLTHALRPDFPVFGSPDPAGELVQLVTSMRNGSDFNLSELKLIVHTGTHVDAPGHFVNELYEAGWDVDSLDLDILVGPVLIVDTPRDRNITAQVLENLIIPFGVQRVLFRTSNTDKKLLWNPAFDSSYTGFTSDGAEWLVTHRPDVRLVGTDYLSVAALTDLKEAHVSFLRKKMILVESLNLEHVDIGLSNLYCLPLRLLKAEGSPVRCILVA